MEGPASCGEGCRTAAPKGLESPSFVPMHDTDLIPVPESYTCTMYVRNLSACHMRGTLYVPMYM